jgi:hypothetical protein
MKPELIQSIKTMFTAIFTAIVISIAWNYIFPEYSLTFTKTMILIFIIRVVTRPQIELNK